MTELITTHTHTNFCGHATGSIHDMVNAAQVAGITTMAITEHYPLTPHFDPHDYISMHKDRVNEYIQTIDNERRAHSSMDILTGCELDWLGDSEDRTISNEDLKPFDVILGSVHFVDQWAFDDPEQRHHWDDVGVDEIWKRYFEIWCEAASSDRPFTIMSHPDLVKKFGYRPTYDPQPLYDQAAEAAMAGHRLIELNTSGAYYACKEVFPAPNLLKAFCHAGVPATVGTDAHQVETVARDIKSAYKDLYEAGYRELTVPTHSGDFRKIPLDD
ncbi:MAG: histidinol-phosphatase [Eggerthellaceae bacterium]|nr:histidinol-phosphatase [Eggerthellaceae bacterium]MCH4221254.1 histidinol-phosphatase [Eggerthellaceae bacterium]